MRTPEEVSVMGNPPNRDARSHKRDTPPAILDVTPSTDRFRHGRRTRRTVDLTPATYRALDVWQREAADRLGLARVTGQEVLTALIDQLLTDPKLSSQITRSIKARRLPRK
jgi:hypothetical protein